LDGRFQLNKTHAPKNGSLVTAKWGVPAAGTLCSEKEKGGNSANRAEFPPIAKRPKGERTEGQGKPSQGARSSDRSRPLREED
jgi:hypothetical protein